MLFRSNDAIMGALAGYGMNLGMNAAGQIVNSAGEVIADSFDEFVASQNQTADQPGDYPTTPADLAAADAELGGIPSPSMIGDQPGDYDTTPEEVAASEDVLGNIPDADTSSPINTNAVQNYFVNQIKNALLHNILDRKSTRLNSSH